MMSTKHSSTGNCLICNSADVAVFMEMFGVPVHCNLLWETEDQALNAETEDIRLGFCEGCGHAFNLAFNPDLMQYVGDYENSLHFSPRFQSYADELARRLIDRYELRGKDIIEIGCGRGDFLKLLCGLGDNRGVGFDPGYTDKSTGENEEQVSFVRDFYSENYSHYRADFICCRHTLEHVHNPSAFLMRMRRAIGERDTAVFFEVPNAMRIWRGLAVWDIIYEHCSYFNSRSLAHLFARCGFDVRNVSEAFEGQYLCIEALPGKASEEVSSEGAESIEELSGLLAAFAGECRRQVEHWRTRLARMKNIGQRAVIWGAGSKGVSFLNALDQKRRIEYVVDINPRKQGKHIAGTGQRIVPPAFLVDYRPDVVIVMNAVYEDEIRSMLESLGVVAELVCV